MEYEMRGDEQREEGLRGARGSDDKVDGRRKAK